jgi:ribosomal protein S21
MAQEVKRKRGETFESLMRRFSRRVQQSGKLLQAKKIRFHTKDKSKNLQRASALRREEIKQKREYLKKIGKLKEETGDFRNKYTRR